jgi:antirestriction protein ArdC
MAKTTKQTREQKVAGVIKQLDEGIKNIIESGQVQAYLDFLAAFHKYSFNNTILIYSQMPYATLVKGFKAWQEVGRRVKKGEKGIRILAPRQITVKETDERGNETKRKMPVGFFSVTVFDISQTEGEPIPDIMKDHTGDDAEQLYNQLLNVIEVPVKFGPTEPGVKGYYSRLDHSIILSDRLTSTNDKTAVLLHEYAHALLHHKGSEHVNKARGIREAQAESVAYVVGKYFGLDLSNFSLGYISYWAQQDLEIIKKIGDEINKTASLIIEKIEQASN